MRRPSLPGHCLGLLVWVHCLRLLSVAIDIRAALRAGRLTDHVLDRILAVTRSHRSDSGGTWKDAASDEGWLRLIEVCSLEQDLKVKHMLERVSR